MSIRLKLYAAFAILVISFSSYFYFIWLPELSDKYVEQNLYHLKKNLQSVSEGVFPLLAEKQLSNIYDNLENAQIQNPDWIYLQLSDMEGNILYPLEEKALPEQTNLIKILNQSIQYQDISLGKLTLVYDFSESLAELQKYLQKLQYVTLGSLTFLCILTGISLELLVLKPMNALSLASQEIANGNFQTSLPKAGHDEVGSLILNFESMKKQLKVSRENIENQVEQRTRQLQESQEQFRFLSEESPIGIIRTDPNGHSNYKNQQWDKIIQYDENAEFNSLDWLSLVHEEDKPEVEKLWQHVVKSGESLNKEFRIYSCQQNIIWVHLQISEVIATQIGSRSRVLTFVDISKRKQAEKERDSMEAQLLHAQKMESIGQLAAGIAHEINTPTQYINDNISFLQESFEELKPCIEQNKHLIEAARNQTMTSQLIEESEKLTQEADVEYLLDEIPQAIEQSAQGIKRVSTIVGAMKEFSHPSSQDKTRCNLNQAIESTITVCRNEWKYIANMETHFDPNLPLVPCIPDELNQVVLNLVVNAAHAIEEVSDDQKTGLITITTSHDQDYAKITITDTGAGIPDEICSKIFDPFFTTKGVGKGTGQGLAIAHSVIVDKHQGTITFETKKNMGTTFIIKLPLSENVET